MHHHVNHILNIKNEFQAKNDEWIKAQKQQYEEEKKHHEEERQNYFKEQEEEE